MSLIKKENLVISIGEVITMQGDNGPYQFFKLWGAGGVVEGKVFAQDQNQGQQPPQQGYGQPPQKHPQQGYSQHPQQNPYNQGANPTY